MSKKQIFSRRYSYVDKSNRVYHIGILPIERYLGLYWYDKIATVTALIVQMRHLVEWLPYTKGMSLRRVLDTIGS